MIFSQNYISLLQSDMLTYGKNTVILWIIGFIPQILTNGQGSPDRTSFTLIMFLNSHLKSKSNRCENGDRKPAMLCIVFFLCANVKHIKGESFLRLCIIWGIIKLIFLGTYRNEGLMDIALLMGEVAFITYKQMIDGIIEQAIF